MDRELIRFLLVGFVAGWISSILFRGRLRLRGCLTHLLVGVTGALIGGYIFDMFGISEVVAVIAAAAGAIGLLVFFQMLRNA